MKNLYNSILIKTNYMNINYISLLFLKELADKILQTETTYSMFFSDN